MTIDCKRLALELDGMSFASASLVSLRIVSPIDESEAELRPFQYASESFGVLTSENFERIRTALEDAVDFDTSNEAKFDRQRLRAWWVEGRLCLFCDVGSRVISMRDRVVRVRHSCEQSRQDRSMRAMRRRTVAP